MPTKIKDIDISEQQWKETVTRIPEMSDIKHYPYKVTFEMLDQAMEKLENREKEGKVL